LCLCPWLLRGRCVELDHPVDAWANQPPCELDWGELRVLPSGQIQHRHWGHHVQPVHQLHHWDILDYSSIKKLQLMHILPGWYISDRDSHGGIIFLHFLPIGYILDRDGDDQQFCVPEVLRLPDRPVQRIQLQQNSQQCVSNMHSSSAKWAFNTFPLYGCWIFWPFFMPMVMPPWIFVCCKWLWVWIPRVLLLRCLKLVLIWNEL
jgi:hypothetical protein